MRRVLKAFAVICIQLLCCPSLSDAHKSIKGKIKLRIYKQSSNNFRELALEQGHILFRESEGYNRTKPIAFIVHGMAMGADSPFVNGVINAFVGRGIHHDYNIFSVDMPELFENSLINEFYLGVLSNVKPAGRKIGRFLNKVINYGLTVPEQINIIGYSMGVQVAGYAARLVKEVFGEINYIAGLDPAGPGFHAIFGKKPRLIHVSKADAKITHFFHTNSISCGTRDRVGTADFVFNNGGTQPGCMIDASLDCSHIRVPFLYIEAVSNPENFVARHCGSWAEFSDCHCNHHETTLLNFPPDEGAHGIYFLRTHSKSPFGMGTSGSRCVKLHPSGKTEYHTGLKNDVLNDPTLLETRNPIMKQKVKDTILPRHHHRKDHHLRDDLNVHIINGIRKIEDLHTSPSQVDDKLQLNELSSPAVDNGKDDQVISLEMTNLDKTGKKRSGRGYLVKYGKKEAELSAESNEIEEDDKYELDEEDLQSLEARKMQTKYGY